MTSLGLHKGVGEDDDFIEIGSTNLSASRIFDDGVKNPAGIQLSVKDTFKKIVTRRLYGQTTKK